MSDCGRESAVISKFSIMPEVRGLGTGFGETGLGGGAGLVRDKVLGASDVDTELSAGSFNLGKVVLGLRNCGGDGADGCEGAS